MRVCEFTNYFVKIYSVFFNFCFVFPHFYLELSLFIINCLLNHSIELCEKYLLVEIIVLSVFASLNDAESYDRIELYGKMNCCLLKKFLNYQMRFLLAIL